LIGPQVGGEVPITHAGVLGQVWRGGRASISPIPGVRGIKAIALDEPLGRAVGRLLGLVGRSDVVDAAVVLRASDGDEIVTVDRSDIETLAAASGRLSS
jgi:hypothetical protein